MTALNKLLNELRDGPDGLGLLHEESIAVANEIEGMMAFARDPSGMHDEAADEIGRLGKENARMKEALQRIALNIPGDLCAQVIASEALRPNVRAKAHQGAADE